MGYQEVQDTSGSVLTCAASDCTYNRSFGCHAPRIQVANDHPACSTYTHDAAPIASPEAAVSLCLSMGCHYNDHARCSAHGITVGTHAGHADCATFREDRDHAGHIAGQSAEHHATVYARY